MPPKGGESDFIPMEDAFAALFKVFGEWTPGDDEIWRVYKIGCGYDPTVGDQLPLAKYDWAALTRWPANGKAIEPSDAEVADVGEEEADEDGADEAGVGSS